MSALTQFRDHGCSAPDCGRPIKARGFCNGHYTRLMKDGFIGTEPLRDRAPKAPGARNLAERLRMLAPEDSSGCWVWIACRHGGYGYVTVAGKNRRAHRVSYEVFVGHIPDGLTLDHLCRNPACVKPAHLEPVTPRENSLRKPSSATHTGWCLHGHEMTPENTMPRGDSARPTCRACERARQAWRKDAEPSLPATEAVACRRGHAFTAENTGLKRGGGRRCKACAHLNYVAAKAKRAAGPQESTA